jgi:hypothetical protein
MALQHTPETQALLDSAIAQIPDLPTCRRGKDVNGNVSNGLGKRTRNAVAKILGAVGMTREVDDLIRPYYLAVQARREALNPEVWAGYTPAPKLTEAEREDLHRRLDARMAEMKHTQALAVLTALGAGQSEGDSGLRLECKDGSHIVVSDIYGDFPVTPDAGLIAGHYDADGEPLEMSDGSLPYDRMLEQVKQWIG